MFSSLKSKNGKTAKFCPDFHKKDTVRSFLRTAPIRIDSVVNLAGRTRRNVFVYPFRVFNRESYAPV